MTFDFRVELTGDLLKLRPLTEADFETLFAVASDPHIWEQHPESDRYKRGVFEGFFRGAIESKGAFLITDTKTGEAIGSSRYLNWQPGESSVEVGYTFLARRCWGHTYNRELKRLMCDYAFRFVHSVIFKIGAKLEAGYEAKRADGTPHPGVRYRLRRGEEAWHGT